ncbi:MAG: glutamine-hydrolyzing GMP synthase [Bryobacteraceae bacterium]|nr:glutamine-hydrolyzing GMP synthase [Bryobacteraceae bacterium]
MEQAQVSVLDTGGQYCHLIARRVRELGIYANVLPCDTPPERLAKCRALIISGGPASVYAPGSPLLHPGTLALGIPLLGICYGQQIIAHQLDGHVEPGTKGEYGLAHLDLSPSPLFAGLAGRQQVWMSHRDQVDRLPSGFRLLGSTDTCPIAAIGDDARRIYGLQFHPEVVQTLGGRQILENFVFAIASCVRDWEPAHQLPVVEEQIRAMAGDRSVFFFASGGVDSTVAYTVCLRALGPERVHATYVDTGLMREGETEFVRGVFESLAKGSFTVADARQEFLGQLATARDPEAKRLIIGEEFVAVQQRILESGHYLDGDWILGQGTIYPDTIESGGTKQADLIKTHHNRVAGIQKLMEQNRLVEPLREFYKDEVRQLGRALGLPDALLDRHPFPGPGLAIRCLCHGEHAKLEKTEDGWLMPVRTVGVQGDSRTYRAVLVIGEPDHALATEIANRDARVNRVVACLASHAPVGDLQVFPSNLSEQRLETLRQADALVRRLSDESGYDRTIWQFPVVLIPAGTPERPDSIVLRPIDSVDGMTATATAIPSGLASEMTEALLALPGIAAVFLDLTHKPPGTIEWE